MKKSDALLLATMASAFGLLGFCSFDLGKKMKNGNVTVSTWHELSHIYSTLPAYTFTPPSFHHIVLQKGIIGRATIIDVSENDNPEHPEGTIVVNATSNKQNAEQCFQVLNDTLFLDMSNASQMMVYTGTLGSVINKTRDNCYVSLQSLFAESINIIGGEESKTSIDHCTFRRAKLVVGDGAQLSSYFVTQIDSLDCIVGADGLLRLEQYINYIGTVRISNIGRLQLAGRALLAFQKAELIE